MKTIKLLLLLWIATVNMATAASQSATGKKGVYLSLEDFIGHHVSYEGSKKIILNRFSGASNIRIIENDQAIKLEKINCSDIEIVMVRTSASSITKGIRSLIMQGCLFTQLMHLQAWRKVKDG